MTKKGTSKYRNDFEHFFHERMGFKILADEAQYEYVQAILAPTSEVQAVFSDSPAGTGKSAIALASAYYLLEKGLISSIGYIRNTVSVRPTGFLPGTVEDKEAAYMKPAQDVLNRIGYKSNNQDLFNELLESGQLFCTSTSFLRGVDYEDNMVLIVDEAQNLDLIELQTVLTRPHDNVKIVVIGSSLQNDNVKRERYGFEEETTTLPFQLYIEHFLSQEEIPVKNITLTRNYRGKFANYADKIQETIKKKKRSSFIEPQAFEEEEEVELSPSVLSMLYSDPAELPPIAHAQGEGMIYLDKDKMCQAIGSPFAKDSSFFIGTSDSSISFGEKGVAVSSPKISYDADFLSKAPFELTSSSIGLGNGTFSSKEKTDG